MKEMNRLDTTHWYVERVLFVMVGSANLITLTLLFVTGSAWWLLITGVVALMQIIYAFTGWCPSALLLRALGVAER